MIKKVYATGMHFEATKGGSIINVGVQRIELWKKSKKTEHIRWKTFKMEIVNIIILEAADMLCNYNTENCLD